MINLSRYGRDTYRITADWRQVTFTLYQLDIDPESFKVPRSYAPANLDDQLKAYQHLYRYVAKLGTRQQKRLMRVTRHYV